MPRIPGVSQCVQYVRDGVIVAGNSCLPFPPAREPELHHVEDGPQVPDQGTVRPPVVTEVSSMAIRSLGEDRYAHSPTATSWSSSWMRYQQPLTGDEEMPFVAFLAE